MIPYATRPLTFVRIDGYEFAVYASDSGRAPSSRPDVPAASPPGPEPVERDAVGLPWGAA